MCCSDKTSPEVQRLLLEYDKTKSMNLALKREIEDLKQGSCSDTSQILLRLESLNDLQKTISKKLAVEMDLNLDLGFTTEDNTHEILSRNIETLTGELRKKSAKLKKFEAFAILNAEVSSLSHKLSSLSVHKNSSDSRLAVCPRMDTLKLRVQAKEKLKLSLKEYIQEVSKSLQLKHDYFSEIGIDLEKVKTNMKNLSELDNLELKIKALEQDIDYLEQHKTNLKTNSDDSLDEDIENFITSELAV